ncbi:MAG: HAMP domain-containing histidine kinase [Acaryochloridaceae cyanobacterium SU_2_1]|nr:HAMP domain-containing histidine kinase [Acaryochloridaceae cyanobacterium SU_2_1]
MQRTLVCPSITPVQDLLNVLPRDSSLVLAASEPSLEPQLDRTQIMVVNAQGQPLGLVITAEILSIGIAHHQHPSRVLPRSLEQPIADWIAQQQQRLEFIPETHTLQEFWQDLHSCSTEPPLGWVIVSEATGEYLGLLDSRQLIAFLAQQDPQHSAIAVLSALHQPSGSVLLDPTSEIDREPQTPSTLGESYDFICSHALLAEISHALQSPLTSITSLAHVLTYQGLGDLSPRQAQYLQLIHQNSQKMMTIVNDLLSLTQLQNPTQACQKVPLNIQSLCLAAIATAKRHHALETTGHAEAAALEIQVQISDRMDSLWSDPSKLQQILVQLLRNALGLNQGPGQINLQVEQWQGWAIFSVIDTGSSIPSAQQALVFDIPQTWTAHGGNAFHKTSLGLVLAQQLARQIAGEISLLSGPGPGNRFSLFVPLGSSALMAVNPHTEGLMLVAATSVEIIAEISQLLCDRQLQPVIARNPADLLHKLQALKPQAMLLQVDGFPSPIEPLLAQLNLATGPESVPILCLGQGTKPHSPHTQAWVNLQNLEPDLDRALNQWLRGNLPHQTLTKSVQIFDHLPLSAAPSHGYKLTILHLEDSLIMPELSQASLETPYPPIYPYDWRIISTTDLEEAEFLAGIWHPDLMLYTSHNLQPLLQLETGSYLRQMPLVITHPQGSEFANRHGDDLKIIHCPQWLQISTQFQFDCSSLLAALEKAAHSP